MMTHDEAVGAVAHVAGAREFELVSTVSFDLRAPPHVRVHFKNDIDAALAERVRDCLCAAFTVSVSSGD